MPAVRRTDGMQRRLRALHSDCQTVAAADRGVCAHDFYIPHPVPRAMPAVDDHLERGASGARPLQTARVRLAAVAIVAIFGNDVCAI